MMSRPQSVFAVYRDDEFLAVGTSKELAEMLNVSLKTIHVFKRKAQHERAKSKKGVAVAHKIDYKEPEELYSAYENIQIKCKQAGTQKSPEIKKEIVKYFRLFKEEYAEELNRKRIKLTDKG